MTDKNWNLNNLLKVSLGDSKDGEALLRSYSPSCVG
jgi:hypothetical protein